MSNLIELAENLTIAPLKKIWIDAEFMALPDDEHHYEIVNGELVDMGNSRALHGYLCSTLMILLGGYVYHESLEAIGC